MTVDQLIAIASENTECFKHFANLTKDRNDCTKLESVSDVLEEIRAVKRYCTTQRHSRDELDDRVFFDAQITEIETILSLPLLGGCLS